MMLVSLIGLSTFSTSLLALVLLRPGPKLADEVNKIKMQYFGRLIYLTVQTNIIGTSYFALELVTALTGFEGTESTVVSAFPMVFALGALLTPLYYSLDYSNPTRQANIRRHLTLGFAYSGWADHLEHASSLPVMILRAITWSRPMPTPADCVAPIVLYVVMYISLTLLNKRLTGVWTYPVFNDLEQKLGSFAIVLLLAVPALLLLLLSFAGVSLCKLGAA